MNMNNNEVYPIRLKKVKQGIVRAQNKNGTASCFHQSQSQSQTTDQSVFASQLWVFILQYA